MSTLEIALMGGLMVVGWTATGLFAGLETGLYTLNHVRLTVRASAGDPAAIRLRRLHTRAERSLIVLLLGTNGANYVGTYGFTALVHGAGYDGMHLVLLEALIVTPTLFIFVETLPKDLFRTHTDRWMYALAPIVDATRWLFLVTGLLPLVQALAALISRAVGGREHGGAGARQRVGHLMRESAGAGAISDAQASLADRVLGLREIRLSEVMVSWPHVARIGVDDARDVREARIASRAFTRWPVVNASGKVTGILSWVDALAHREQPTRELMTEPLVVDPDARVVDAITLLRRERQPMAIVTQPETGRPLGIVTLKDLVEPLTGKLGAW